MSVKTKTELRDYADANINTNGTQSITGAVQNTMLNDMIDSFALDSDITQVYGGMYLDTNTSSQTPIANQVIGMTEFTTGPVSGFTFQEGNGDNFTATADNGSYVTITLGASHGGLVGDYIVIYQSSSTGSYDITGVYEIMAIAATTVDITFANWDSTETGSWQIPSQLQLVTTGITSEVFDINWSLSISAAGSPSGDEVDWVIYVNDTEYKRTEVRRTLTTAGDWGSCASGGLIPMSTNDVVFLTFHSDDTNALTHRYGSLRVKQL